MTDEYPSPPDGEIVVCEGSTPECGWMCIPRENIGPAQQPTRNHSMRVAIRDTEAQKAVSPAALSAYARTAGWSKAETYGDHSDVYVAHGQPEIILPRTEHLGDYADVVSRLVEIFANAVETDELSLGDL